MTNRLNGYSLNNLYLEALYPKSPGNPYRYWGHTHFSDSLLVQAAEISRLVIHPSGIARIWSAAARRRIWSA